MLNIPCFVASAALVVGTLPLALQSAAVPAPAQTQVFRPLIFPVPRAELVLGGGSEYSLADLVDDFSRATGEYVLLSADTKILLADIRPALNGPLVVEPEEVYTVVQDVLNFNRFAMSNVRREEPRMLSISSLDAPNRGSLKSSAMYIAEDHFHEFAGDSAFMVTTTVTLSNIVVRRLGNSLRQVVVDPNVLQIIPIEASNRVVLTGFASRVHGIVQMLHSLDEGASQASPSSQQQQQGQTQPGGDGAGE